jgi:hypothetical protein
MLQTTYTSCSSHIYLLMLACMDLLLPKNRYRCILFTFLRPTYIHDSPSCNLHTYIIHLLATFIHTIFSYTATWVHMWFTFLQPTYIHNSHSCALNAYMIHLHMTCIHTRITSCNLHTCMENSTSFVHASFLWIDFPPLDNSPMIKSSCSLGQMQTHLCRLHHVSTHSLHNEMP